MMEYFAQIIKSFRHLTNFAKFSNTNALESHKYTSVAHFVITFILRKRCWSENFKIFCCLIVFAFAVAVFFVIIVCCSTYLVYISSKSKLMKFTTFFTLLAWCSVGYSRPYQIYVINFFCEKLLSTFTKSSIISWNYNWAETTCEKIVLKKFLQFTMSLKKSVTRYKQKL